jgi:uncharacterized repeat protein (TIGR01451 family)
MKDRRINIAVSEIIGTLLLLGIAVSSFSALNYYVVSAPTPNPSPIVELSGMIEENQIVLMHNGGETLDLNTELLIMLGDTSEKVKVGDFLDAESKSDGVWSLGEKVVFPVLYDFDYVTSTHADIVIVDKGSSTVIMTGSVEVDPVCDLGIEITVDNQFPGLETNIVFTITVTNNGNINASGIQVNFNVPEELIHYHNTTTQGTYTNSSGLWDIGKLIPEQSVVLIIEVTVGERGSLETTQLVMLLDGSGSINSADWTLQVEGLAAAVANNHTFPQDNSVELTVIQFGGGGWDPPSPGHAQIEIGPIVINESNVASIENSIRNIPQLRSMTPTACSIYLSADTVINTDIFDPNIRQIIMMVTDGNPTQGCDCDGDYTADDWDSGNYKPSAEVARDYLITTLGMTVDQDEFNAIAVGESASHASWLKENIVWPEPGQYAPPFPIGSPRRGWLRNVTTWQEFAETIDECFGIIFNQVNSEVEISAATFTDPKEANDFDLITIIPSSTPFVITKDATDIDDKNATLNMYYNFKWVGSGEVRFMYKEIDDDDFAYTPWEAQSDSGTYSKQITGLSSITNYIYQAQLRYDSATKGTTIVNVKEKTFDTVTAATI